MPFLTHSLRPQVTRYIRLSMRCCLMLCLISASSLKASVYDLPQDSDLIGEISTITANKEDTLLDIAIQHNLGYNEIVAANPDIDPWLPHEGAEIILPSLFILPDVVRKGIVINLAEMRLYYFMPQDSDGEALGKAQVVTHPIGIGKEGWSTPTGAASVISKVKNPTWTVPASLIEEKRLEGFDHPKVVPPGPDNPLGDYAMRLSMPSYLIHGTNQPYGVGRRVSHGCIRLYPDSIADLFSRVPLNTPVTIVNKPFKAGYGKEGLYLEVHKPLEEVSKEEVDEIAIMLAGFGAMTREKPVEKGEGEDAVQSVIEAIKSVAQFQDGLPHLVLKGASPPTFIEENHWVVQIGAYTNLPVAERWLNKLKLLDQPAAMIASLEDGMCHLVVGPYDNRETTIKERDRLEDLTGVRGRVQRADRPGMLAACEL